MGKPGRRRYTAPMKSLRILISMAACCVAVAASAQWQWVDKNGKRVFSDRPPPADVPEQNILKRPASRTPTPAAASGVAAPAAPTPTAGTDKALEDKRKQVENAEAARRKAEEERIARQKAENCAKAQQAKAALDAGGRVARMNDRGEREFLDENALAAEQQRLQAMINENCY